MSIKSRSEKINQATDNVILTSKNTGFIRSERTYYWSFERLSNQIVKFGRRKVEVRVYQSDCHNTVNTCKGNSQSRTVCYHILGAYQETMRLAGVTVYKVDNANHAYKLLNFGCSLVKILSNNGHAVMLAVKRDGSDQGQAIENVKNLLETKRIALQKPGQAMSIAYKVELYRRNDDTFALRSGSITSKPIVRYGRDYSSVYAVDGMWKLSDEVSRNWQEFINKVLPKESLAERVELMRGPVEMGID